MSLHLPTQLNYYAKDYQKENLQLLMLFSWGHQINVQLLDVTPFDLVLFLLVYPSNSFYRKFATQKL
jgi:hypothetical protein